MNKVFIIKVNILRTQTTIHPFLKAKLIKTNTKEYHLHTPNVPKAPYFRGMNLEE